MAAAAAVAAHQQSSEEDQQRKSQEDRQADGVVHSLVVFVRHQAPELAEKVLNVVCAPIHGCETFKKSLSDCCKDLINPLEERESLSEYEFWVQIIKNII